ETTYTIRIDDQDEENEPSPEQKSNLSGVMTLHKSDRMRDSAMFGGTKPRKVGDSWPVDPDAAAKIYKDNQLDVRPKHITGTVKLVDVETYNGRECLHVAVDVQIADFRVLPTTREADDDDYKMKSASMTSHVEWLIDASGDEKHYASFSTVRKYRSEG